MTHLSDLIATDIDEYLAQHERKELLRFLTCGSVDDGKSTLIGRLFFDTKMIAIDTLESLMKDSVTHGTTGGEFDPALYTDGLKAEREQGITIDVAYRYFSTAKRKFIIADCPGHEQYTRNMATGASTCDLAIILVDARNGVVEQTKRHSFIVSLLGIRHVVVAVNKMDLMDYREEVFEKVKQDYTDFVARLDIADLHFIPISALKGENVVEKSDKTPWYQGESLMYLLENVHIASDRNLNDFRFPVQYVNRPHLDFRGFCGTIASGIIREGDEVMAFPSRKTSRVKKIVAFDGDLPEAFAPQAVTITLEHEIDISRGDVICRPGNQPQFDRKFEAMVVWMAEQPMVPGKEYLIKHATKTVTGAVQTLRYRIDVNTLHRQDAPTLRLNEIGRCELLLNESIAFDPYRRNPGTGAFIIIDRLSNATVAAGMITERSGGAAGDHWDDQPATELHKEISQVTARERQARFGQKPATVLLTGLTGAGKTTIAYALERRLFDEGRAATVLDGQNMRLGISKDLGFTAEERSENLRRSAEAAKLMNDAGLICLAAFVAPEESVRRRAGEVIGEDRFLLVHLSAPVEVCRQRDPDGHYPQADAGQLKHFPGVTAPYDAPQQPDLNLPTHEWPVEKCVDALMDLLQKRGVIG
ncbi:MAG: sulfate adenylyltransferase subunit CysN [Planctomycetes bacterium]|nr:sulfate adenylyltransferase subunit CysN [Planctomycetota bacterium]